jgi:hypothetical protein
VEIVWAFVQAAISAAWAPLLEESLAPRTRRFALEFGILHFPEEGRNKMAVQKHAKSI